MRTASVPRFKRMRNGQIADHADTRSAQRLEDARKRELRLERESARRAFECPRCALGRTRHAFIARKNVQEKRLHMNDRRDRRRVIALTGAPQRAAILRVAKRRGLVRSRRTVVCVPDRECELLILKLRRRREHSGAALIAQGSFGARLSGREPHEHRGCERNHTVNPPSTRETHQVRRYLGCESVSRKPRPLGA